MDTKVIHTHIYNPSNSLFKTSKNDKAEMTQILCSNYENCGLFKNRQCCWVNIFSKARCPYGAYSRTEGYSRRAKGFSSWISNNKDKYKDSLDQLNSANDKMTIIGDYIYFPYAHLENYVNPIKEVKAEMIHKDLFTPELLVNIFKLRPQALFGGVISDYQKKEVPKMITHLKEVFPEIFKKVLEIYPDINNIISKYSNVGRKAKLLSLKSGITVYKKDESWVWDGEYLTSSNLSILFPIVRYSGIECKIKPNDDAVITITSDDQVDENTIYVD